VNYAVDVAGSLLVGLASALVVTVAGHTVIFRTVEQLSKLSDPLVGAVRGAIGGRPEPVETRRCPVWPGEGIARSALRSVR
jgi:hypothetical protein